MSFIFHVYLNYVLLAGLVVIFSAEFNDMTILEGQLKAISEHELTAHEIRAALPLVNWEEVARMYVVKRTPIECLIKYAIPLSLCGSCFIELVWLSSASV